MHSASIYMSYTVLLQSYDVEELCDCSFITVKKSRWCKYYRQKYHVCVSSPVECDDVNRRFSFSLIVLQ